MADNSLSATQLIRECMATAVRMAITRHNLELDPDAATEEEIAYDAAGACFGEECCDDKPIPELARLLAALSVESGEGTPQPDEEKAWYAGKQAAEKLMQDIYRVARNILDHSDALSRPQGTTLPRRCSCCDKTEMPDGTISHYLSCHFDQLQKAVDVFACEASSLSYPLSLLAARESTAPRKETATAPITEK